MHSNRTFKLSALILILMATGMALGIYTAQHSQRNNQNQYMEGVFWPDPKQIGPFTTTDQHGDEFGLERLQGKWSFLFFGYTHCPDICPVTLSVMNEFHQRLEREGMANDVQTLFITVDPERDTPERLANYMSYFNPTFSGLGGTIEQINSMASQIGVVYLYGERSATGDYFVDHSSSLFLLDPKARLVSIFSAPHELESISSRFDMIRKFILAQDKK